MAYYYVDNSGGDGDGSEGNPWNNIAGHVNALSAGDTMLVRGDDPGLRTYTEAQITLGVNGSDGSPITLKPYGTENVKLTISSGFNQIDITHDWWVVEGFEIDHANKYLRAIQISGDRNIVRDCTIHNSHQYLVWIAEGNYNTIDGCTIYDCYWSDNQDAMGVALVGTSSCVGNTVENCTIYDITGDCVQADGSAVDDTTVDNNHLYTTLGKCSENGVDIKNGVSTIVNNVLHGFRHCDSTCGGSGGPGFAIGFQSTLTDVATVEDNEIYDCPIGIWVNAPTTIHLHRNVFRDMITDATGDYPNAVLRLTSNGTTNFYNNTVENAPDPLLWEVGASVTLNVRNCIFENTGTLEEDGTVVADYNLWHNHAERNAGAHDVVDEDPLFVGGDDYHLKVGSPAIDAGVDVGLDYLGLAPDMGAFETRYVGPLPMFLRN